MVATVFLERSGLLLRERNDYYINMLSVIGGKDINKLSIIMTVPGESSPFLCLALIINASYNDSAGSHHFNPDQKTWIPVAALRRATGTVAFICEQPSRIPQK